MNFTRPLGLSIVRWEVMSIFPWEYAVRRRVRKPIRGATVMVPDMAVRGPKATGRPLPRCASRTPRPRLRTGRIYRSNAQAQGVTARRER